MVFLTLNQIVLIAQNNISDLSLEELMNVEVVTASKVSEKLKNAPATILVITAEQIEERGYRCLDDVLRDLPGFDLVHVNGTWPTIWAQRGSYGDENKRTLLLIDGIVENNLLEGSVLGGEQYSLHNVKQIEIMYGPGSALYGANAFSGIINIITKDGDDVNGIEYKQGFGNFNTHFEKILTGYKKNDFSFVFSGSIFNTDGPVFPERHPNYNNSYVDNAYSISLKTQYKNFKAGFYRYDRPMGDGEFSNSPTVLAYGLPPYGYENSEGMSGGEAQTDINGEKGTLWHSVTETLYLKHTINTKSILLENNLYYRKSGIAADSYSYDFNGENFVKYGATHSSRLYGFSSTITIALNEYNSLTSGIQYEYSNVEKGYRQRYESEENVFSSLDNSYREFVIYKNTAVFTQFKHQFRDFNASLIAGLRYDINNIYQNSLNPRVGVVFNPNPVTTVKLLYGEAFRAPNNFELYSETNIRIANPDLKSENAKSWSLDVSKQISPEFTLTVSCFYNYFSDLIVSNVDIGDVTGDGINNTMNLNISEARIKGIELKAEFEHNNFSIFSNITLQDGKELLNDQNYQQPCDNIPNIAKFKGNFGISHTHTFGKFFITANYVGKRSTYATNPLKSVPSYTLVNLNFTSKSFFNNKAKFFTRVDNLFDTKWEDPGIRGGSGEYYGTVHSQPGISYSFGFTLKY